MAKRTPKSESPPDLPAHAMFDFFSDVHENTEPEILNDGRSIKFPYDWSQADADKWRYENGLWPKGKPYPSKEPGFPGWHILHKLGEELDRKDRAQKA